VDVRAWSCGSAGQLFGDAIAAFSATPRRSDRPTHHDDREAAGSDRRQRLLDRRELGVAVRDVT
jgi:hypothetical protein